MRPISTGSKNFRRGHVYCEEIAMSPPILFNFNDAKDTFTVRTCLQYGVFQDLFYA